MILVFSFLPSITLASTPAKIPRARTLLIDFAFNNLLNGSPSSISSEFLITFSCVILFPRILEKYPYFAPYFIKSVTSFKNLSNDG